MDSENQQHTASCPLCGNNSNFFASITFNNLVGMTEFYIQNVFACDYCDFIFTNNYLDKEIVNNYYKNVSKYEGDVSGHVDNSKKKMTQRQFDFIKSAGIDYASVLELGASTGFNLNTFRQNGKIVYGVEPSCRNKQNAKKLYGVDLYDGMYEEFYSEHKSNTYDLIIMSHVLEHIENPREMVNKLNEQNNKYIYIEVPSFEIQLESEPYGSFFYEHVNHFTTNSLMYLMNSEGYGIKKLSIEYNVDEESPKYPVICSLWEKSDSFNRTPIILHSSLILENYLEISGQKFSAIRQKIDEITNEAKVAVWGTGSHTSRLLGMTNLQDKNIVKFYDSDIKKHQFRILDREITAFDKEDIDNGLIDTIVISTFSGEESIMRFIDSLNLENINIVALYS